MNYIIIFINLLFLAGAGWAAPDLRMIPIQDARYEKDVLTISYQLPCGAQRQGLFVSTEALSNSLNIGVVIKQEGSYCASLPQTRREALPFINYKGFTKIVKLAPRPDEVLELSSPRETRIAQRNNRWSAQVIYEASCTKFAGFVLNATDKRTVEIGFLGRSVPSFGGASCPLRQEIKDMDFLVVTKKTKLRPMLTPAPSLLHAFHLRLAKIDPKSYSASASGSTELRYLRRCNEAPVGVVVEQDAKQSKIGFLVAHYYNWACTSTLKRRLWERYRLPGVSLADPLKVSFLAPSSGLGKYSIVAPTRFAVKGAPPSVKTSAVEIGYLGGCHKRVGAVYARLPSSDTLSVGVVRRVANAPCRSTLREIHLRQQNLGNSTAISRAVPMVVTGYTLF